MRRMLALVATGVLIGSGRYLQASAADNGGCASTPAAALLAARTGSEAGSTTNGFRVNSLRWDPLLQQSWAVILSCDHPERPPMTLLTDMLAPHSPAHFTLATARSYVVLPIVRAGDVVRIWRQDRFARIEILGTAEENGAVGSRVRVRLPASRDLEGQVGPTQYLAGVVRGPADVEMAQ